jgi:hypothetical protein
MAMFCERKLKKLERKLIGGGVPMVVGLQAAHAVAANEFDPVMT